MRARAEMLDQAKRSKLGADQARRVKGGKAAERELAPQNREIERRGQARIIRNEPPFRVTGSTPDGGVRGFFEARGSTDFGGFMLPSGLPLALEVKSIAPAMAASGGLQPPRFRLSEVKDHQRADLALVQRTRGVAVLVVFWAGECYAVPWSVCQAALVRRERTLGPEILKQWTVQPLMGETWLDVIR